MLAEKDIKRMREIFDATTPGPLTFESDKASTTLRGPKRELVAFVGCARNPQGRADALFFVAAHRAIPVLLAEIERLQGLVAA